MTELPSHRLHVLADLDLEVDGQVVQIRCDGTDIVVQAADAAGLSRHIGVTAAAVGGGLLAKRRLLGRMADAANRAGVRITVVGRGAPVAAIGRGVNVRASSWLVRSPHVRVRPGRESFAALVALLRR